MRTGIYDITIKGRYGYLTDGTYIVTVGEQSTHFRNIAHGGATFEANSTLSAYVERGIILMTEHVI
jgi:hypothetical protein